MTDKPKRKNDQPIPRRYWWIFGTLAIVLLIGLRFPIRLKAPYELNVIFYVLLGISCTLATIHFINRFHWRHKIVIVMLTCVVLISLNIVNDEYGFFAEFDSSCESEYHGFFSVHYCGTLDEPTACFVAIAEYLGIRSVPIAIRTNFYVNGTCSLF